MVRQEQMKALDRGFRGAPFNESGFSIIGALVGAAAMLVIGLAVSQMIQTQSDFVYYLEDRLSAVNLKGDLQLALGERQTCIRSLNGVPGGFASLASSTRAVRLSIRNASGDVLYGPDSRYDRLAFRSITARATGTINPTTPGIVEFVVEPGRTRGRLAQALAPIRIQKQVRVNASSVVVDCSAVGGSGALNDLLKTARIFETSQCLWNDSLNTLTVECPPDRALIACSGGPGDQDESSESYLMVPDYATDRCTMTVAKPRCNGPSRPDTYQKVIAACYLKP